MNHWFLIEIVYVILLFNNTLVSECGDLSAENTVFVLVNNVSSTSSIGTCFTVSNENITIDCQGHLINYSKTGAGVDSYEYNTTVRNCIFNDGIPTLNNVAIYFDGAYGSIINNTIITSTFYAFSRGISIDVEANFTTILNNTIITYGKYGYGIYLYSSYNNVSENTITTSGTDTWGIYLYPSSFNSISNNKITTGERGIRFYSSTALGDSHSNIISNNIITAPDYGIYFYYSITEALDSNNSFYNNFINSSVGVGYSGIICNNTWNISNQIGTRIYSNGTNISGNYWTNPSGTSYSDTCIDSDTNGFCDVPYNVTSGLAANGIGNNIDYLPLSDEYCEGDCILPSFSNNQTNASSTTYNGTTVQINLTITDNVGLSSYRLTTNDTLDGGWVNQSVTSASGTSVTAIFNYSIQNFPSTGGTFGWRVWANDTAGNLQTSATTTFYINILPTLQSGSIIDRDLLQGLPQIGNDMSSFIKNIAPGIGTFIIIISIFAGIAALLGAVIIVIMGGINRDRV